MGCREYKAFTYERSAAHILSPEMERPPFWTRAFVVGIPGAELKVIHTIAHLIRVALPLFLRGEPPFEVFEMQTCNLVENQPSLVVYDAIAGGTGVADWLGRGNNFQKVLESALSILESCPCESGCRGCTSIHDCHIPNSKSATCELDKIGTIRLLAEILGKEVDDLIKFRTKAIELSEDVHKMVQHLVDFVFPHKLGLEIEQPANIQVKPNLDSRFRGIYFSANNKVWVMPLKEMDMLMVLAHEYAHNWQWQGKNRMCAALMEASMVPYFDGKLFIEGFAQWVEYKVADYYGYRVEMDQIHFAHYNEYAEGFQVLRWIEDAGGAGKVMEFIRTGKLTLDGQDIPLERMIDRSGVRARLQDWKNRFETTPPDNDVDVPVEETEDPQEDGLDSSTKDPDTDEKESAGPKTEVEPD